MLSTLIAVASGMHSTSSSIGCINSSPWHLNNLIVSAHFSTIHGFMQSGQGVLRLLLCFLHFLYMFMGDFFSCISLLFDSFLGTSPLVWHCFYANCACCSSIKLLSAYSIGCNWLTHVSSIRLGLNHLSVFCSISACFQLVSICRFLSAIFPHCVARLTISTVCIDRG